MSTVNDQNTGAQISVDVRTFDQNMSVQTPMGGGFRPYYSHDGSFLFDV
jgi:hypothetical protein